jgi:hypothetical protein
LLLLKRILFLPCFLVQHISINKKERANTPNQTKPNHSPYKTLEKINQTKPNQSGEKGRFLFDR